MLRYSVSGMIVESAPLSASIQSQSRESPSIVDLEGAEESYSPVLLQSCAPVCFVASAGF